MRTGLLVLGLCAGLAFGFYDATVSDLACPYQEEIRSMYSYSSENCRSVLSVQDGIFTDPYTTCDSCQADIQGLIDAYSAKVAEFVDCAYLAVELIHACTLDVKNNELCAEFNVDHTNPDCSTLARYTCCQNTLETYIIAFEDAVAPEKKAELIANAHKYRYIDFCSDPTVVPTDLGVCNTSLIVNPPDDPIYIITTPPESTSSAPVPSTEAPTKNPGTVDIAACPNLPFIKNSYEYTPGCEGLSRNLLFVSPEKYCRDCKDDIEGILLELNKEMREWPECVYFAEEWVSACTFETRTGESCYDYEPIYKDCTKDTTFSCCQEAYADHLLEYANSDLLPEIERFDLREEALELRYRYLCLDEIIPTFLGSCNTTVNLFPAEDEKPMNTGSTVFVSGLVSSLVILIALAMAL